MLLTFIVLFILNNNVSRGKFFFSFYLGFLMTFTVIF